MMYVVPMFSQELLTKESLFSFAETVKAIESTLKRDNFTIFAKIDQADAAKKAGTSLMQENPVWVLDLALKVAVYEDSNTITYISAFDMKKLLKEIKYQKLKCQKSKQ